MGNKVRKEQINDDLVKITCLGITKRKKKISEHFIKGHHEAEICYGGEADLHKHYTDCKKNPGHVNFIPVNDFNLDHLPWRYRDAILLELIKALSALTVLIKVKYTSLDRPESVTFYASEYPCYKDRGSDVLRIGTGRIWAVNKYINSEIMGTCPCGKCQHYGGSKVWAEIDIVTATHVVFDESEVKQTQCVLNFNSSESKVITLNGLEIVGKSDIERDWCMFKCVSCDLELIEELDKICSHFNSLCKTVWKVHKYSKTKLAVIVSHPHGYPKMVSIGRRTEKHTREGDMYKYTKYTYTTPTCPGSSGAFVYTMAFDKLSLSHPHSGSNLNGNYSGEDWLSLG